MPDFRVVVEPGAKADVRDGFEYYRSSVDLELARSFRDAVLAGVAKIAEAPERWPRFDDEGGRRYLLKRFPYAIVYDLEGSTITILAVMHLRREPGYWRAG